MPLSKWIYDVDDPFNVVNSPFFQKMLDVVQVLVLDIKGLIFMILADIF